jgi:hypothetical protein
MARLAREETETLKARIAALELAVSRGDQPSQPGWSSPPSA